MFLSFINKFDNLKLRLIEDINYLQSTYKSTAIITKDMKQAEKLYELIKDDFETKEAALKHYSTLLDDDDAEYEKVYTLDLSDLEPVCTINYKPDQIKKISEMEGTKVDQIYIGSCTNGRISDLRIAGEILKGKHIAKNVRGIISPATTERASLDVVTFVLE